MLGKISVVTFSQEFFHHQAEIGENFEGIPPKTMLVETVLGKEPLHVCSHYLGPGF